MDRAITSDESGTNSKSAGVDGVLVAEVVVFGVVARLVFGVGVACSETDFGAAVDVMSVGLQVALPVDLVGCLAMIEIHFLN